MKLFNKSLLSAFGGILLGLVPSQAQTPWTLRECIRYALEHNITVQQRQISVQQSEIDLNTSQNSRLPSVGSSVSQNFSFGRGLTADNTYENTNTTSTGFSLGVDVPVFQGFNIKNNILMNKLNLEAATRDLEKAKDDIRVAVAQAYVQILYNMEILDVAEARIEIDSLQVERLELMLQNGKTSAAEVAQQKASLAQSKYQKIQASNNLNISLLDLSQLLELPSPEGFSIVRPTPSAMEPRLLDSAEDIYQSAVAVKPAILAEQTRLDVASTRINMAKNSILPTISLSGGLGTNYYTASKYPSSSFSSQIKNNFSQYVGLSLSLPIFSRFQNRNSIRTANLNYRTQELQLENTKKSLYKEIQQAYYNALASQEKYFSSSQVLESSRQAFELVSAKYENGKANITEFNESKNNYTKAQSDFVQAQYENLFQTRILDFYKGMEIDF
ncbi:MAG: TolC family protein [Bacteroidales bacterium]|nr:TolC family protein [Bacteroidales bacterium]MBQ6578376.1 TolC family protein [Bacteroidales bacterium]